MTTAGHLIITPMATYVIIRTIRREKRTTVSVSVNLAHSMKEQLPAELVRFMQIAGELAQSRGQKLYLVGGVVRDLLLNRPNLDLDLVVEGDAIKLAHALLCIKQAKITIHPRFGTAKLQWDKWNVDLATARSETYNKPGALPTVQPGSISNDFFRRDFTINTMAINLNPDCYGELLDSYGGRDDIAQKFIRVLHENSFVDDATRIWRGLRYEQRLNFKLEPATLCLIKRDLPMLATISGDRIRHELELILKEDLPEKILCRADELEVLTKLHPSLKGNGWLAEKFEQARQLSPPDLPSASLYLSLLTYRLTGEENNQLISYLKLPKSAAKVLQDTISIKAKLQLLENLELTPSSIYSLLHSFSLTAITANMLTSDSPIARKNIHLFLQKLRHVKLILTGEDLKMMGVAPGPHIKKILTLLREARLDGKTANKRDEEKLVIKWLTQG